MAKVAKKSASSSKKSVASAKPAAKKADKQKKTTVKATPTASKKKAAPAPKAAAKKPAPAKPVAKKVAAKKPSKPVAAVKKAPAKAAKVVASKKVAPKAKVAAKKPVAKADPKPAAKAAPSNKKIAVPVKGKAVVAKAAPAKPEKTVPQKTKPAEVKKAPAAPAQPPIPVAKAAAVAGKPRRKKKKNDDDDDDEEVVVFRKPAKKVSSAVKKSSSKYISEELTMEGPAPKRIGQITMTSDEKIKLKKALLNKCIDIQKNTVSIAKKAMEDALTSANAEKVTEELSDSFRESMHATRDMYARQANEGVNNLGLLNRINIVEHEKVKFGSVVFTNFQNYFISTGLGEIKIDDLSFQAVSTLAPLFQILVDKKKGDTFMFLDRLYTVIEVF